MARGASHVLGLDIGNESIKVVELALGRHGVRLVTEPAVVPTPTGAVAGGVIVDPDAVASVLREMLAGKRVKTRTACISVGGDTSVVARVISMPRMTGKELDEAMQWELDRQTPFPVDQVIYDFAPLPAPEGTGDAENMDVFLAVGQEDMINDHIQALRAAKVTPIVIDVEPLALGRALIGLPGGEHLNNTVVVIDCGATFTGIYVFRQGWPAFLRTIPIAGEKLTEAIREHIDVDREQAEHVKRQFADVSGMAYEGPPPESSELESDALAAESGVFEDIYEESSASAVAESPLPESLETIPATEFDVEVPVAPEAPPEEAAGEKAPSEAPLAPEAVQARALIGEAISQPVYDLVTEITRSLDFYRRQARGERMSEILLCGGTAHLRGLASLLGAETGIPTRIANPFESIVADGVAVPEYLRDLGPQMAVAVGLALRDMVD